MRLLRFLLRCGVLLCAMAVILCMVGMGVGTMEIKYGIGGIIGFSWICMCLLYADEVKFF